MGADWYLDFIAAACAVAGETARGGVEVTEDGRSVVLDPETELRLCVGDPDGLERVRASLVEFNKACARAEGRRVEAGNH